MRVLLTLHHALTSDAGAPGATLALGRALEAHGATVDYYAFDHAFGAAGHEGIADQLRFPFHVAAHLARDGRRYDVIDASTGDAWAWASLRRPGGPACQALVTRAHGLEHVVSANARRAAAEGKRQLSWKYPIYHGGLRLWEVRRSLLLADHCVMLNEVDRDFARDRLGVAPSRVSVMPNAIGPHFVTAADVNGAVPEGPVRLAFIGRWIPRKGTQEMVEAATSLLERGVDFSLSILGAGEEDVLADFPAEARERISVTPQYANDELPDLLAGREILVFPSQSEGSSVALLEAMSCGLAPVATRVGSAPETIEEQREGMLIEPGDAAGVADAVERMAGDRAKLGEMRRAAQAKARGHRWDVIANDTVRLYERVLEGCGGPRTAR